MEHIGIDLGSEHSHVAIVGAGGQKFGPYRVETRKLAGFLRDRPKGMVVMETCTQSRAISVAALAAGHEVRVVPGQLVRQLGVGSRGIKTDDRDATMLAEASARNGELPGVHLRSAESARIKTLLASRQALVSSRSSFAAAAKSWLRGHLLNVRGRASSKHFTEAFRRLVARHNLELPVAISRMLSAYEDLSGHIDALSAEIEMLAKSDPTTERLMTMPGVGPIVAMAFKSHVDDPRRFSSSSKLGSFLALVPGECTTGGKIKRTSTIRAGCQYMKALLIQAAWSMWRCQPTSPLVTWARLLAERRGKRIAIVALARKMAFVLWAMWKNGESYDPSRASSHQPAAVQTDLAA